MEFSRIGKHTLKCVISEQEILDLGYTLDDIMSNGEKTQEFMNHIFDLAEKKFQTKFEIGIKTVRADFMSDHTLALTFSEHPGTGGMVEHLKDIVSGLIDNMAANGFKAESSEKNQKSSDMEDFTMPSGVKIDVMFLFDSMENVIRFAKVMTILPIPRNALYKFEDMYFLFMDLSDSAEADVKRLSMTTDEYAYDIVVGAQKRAFVEEHGDLILKEKAIEQLRML